MPKQPVKPNYVQQMDAVMAQLAEQRPRLLLHACCGPCSSSVLEVLEQHFDITILYYNPNTWPPEEYERRGEELAKFLEKSGREQSVALAWGHYDPQEFYAIAAGHEADPERGDRCTRCYRLRLEETARYAAEHGFDWFCTTLSLSPHKDAVRINQIGEEMAKKYQVRHLPNEFKKRDGYRRSLALSDEYGLYRQDYCGCEFSAKAAQAHRAIKAAEEAASADGPALAADPQGSAQNH